MNTPHKVLQPTEASAPREHCDSVKIYMEDDQGNPFVCEVSGRLVRTIFQAEAMRKIYFLSEALDNIATLFAEQLPKDMLEEVERLLASAFTWTDEQLQKDMAQIGQLKKDFAAIMWYVGKQKQESSDLLQQCDTREARKACTALIAFANRIIDMQDEQKTTIVPAQPS